MIIIAIYQDLAKVKNIPFSGTFNLMRENMAKYTDDFKKKVADYYGSNESKSFKAVAEKFNVHPTLVRNWYIKFSQESSTPSIVSAGVDFDLDELESSLEDLSYEIEEFYLNGAGSISPEDCSGSVLTVVDESGAPTINIDLMTSEGDFDVENGERIFIAPPGFDADAALDALVDEFGEALNEVLTEFGQSLDSISIKVSAYPEEGM